VTRTRPGTVADLPRIGRSDEVSMRERFKGWVAIVSVGAVISAMPAVAASSVGGLEMASGCRTDASGPAPDGSSFREPDFAVAAKPGPSLRDLIPAVPVGHDVGVARAPHFSLEPSAAGGWKNKSTTVKVWTVVGVVVIGGIIAASMNSSD
jgi:hypothetical protein